MIPKKFIEYYGDDVRWWTGKVISINDPLEIARIQVRIYGIHNDDTTLLPDEDLPWAQVLSSSDQGGLPANGNTLGIQVGALAFGFFLDGKNSQAPLVLGSVPVEGNMNPLATGTQTKEYTPDADIGEPDDPYAAVYPNNLVYETTAGHVKEYDNTPDAERIRELHKSGTFYQVSPDGDLVTHVVRDRYTVIVRDDAVHITGNVNLIIDENCTTTIGGDWNVDVEGDIAINGKTINLNRGTEGAARIGDTADTGDDPAGISAGDGTNRIETGSGTVFIGD